MLKLLVFSLILCIILTETLSARNPYCAAGLCPGRTRHIACGNSGRFSARCPNDARMVPMRRLKKQILHIHNSKRNLIASGRVRGYQAARRMATMQWDNELARLAALNVKQCAMIHDKCRNTRRFGKAGQNLAMLSYSGNVRKRSNTACVRNRVNAWFREYSNCNMRYINRYPTNYNGAPIGHFTVFVNEKNIRVGCAAARFTRGRLNSFLIACNYAITNVSGEPVYQSGNAARGCRTGRNRKYPSLCSKRERYGGLK